MPMLYARDFPRVLHVRWGPNKSGCTVVSDVPVFREESSSRSIRKLSKALSLMPRAKEKNFGLLCFVGLKKSGYLASA